jgi:hypothetical protein
MSDAAAFVGLAIGVVVAVAYPVLRGFIRKEFPPVAGTRMPPWVRRYGGLLLFSLVTAFVLLAIYRSTNPTTELGFWPAVVMGFGWEAIIEKLWPERR